MGARIRTLLGIALLLAVLSPLPAAADTLDEVFGVPIPVRTDGSRLYLDSRNLGYRENRAGTRRQIHGRFNKRVRTLSADIRRALGLKARVAARVVR